MKLFTSFLRPLISNELKKLIQQMLDKNPETRITVPEVKVTITSTQNLWFHKITITTNVSEAFMVNVFVMRHLSFIPG